MTPVIDSARVPAVPLPGGGTLRTLVRTGAGLIRQLAEVPAGVRYAGTAGPAGELWFVLDGGGELRAGETAASVAERHGVLLPPECPFELTAGEGGLRLDIAAPPAGTPVTAGGVRVTGLADCPAEITGDRRFRVLFGPDNGCAAVTQFAGEIPPGRAAPHRHEYDEVVLILAGTGVLHAGEQAGGDGGYPLAPGRCAHLPPGLAHCLENTGSETLEVLGVFHPGGSPAAKKLS